MKKQLLLVVVCLGLAGCDYTVPLTSTPELEIDSKLVGLWKRAEAPNQTESLLVLPLSRHEYMVNYPLSATNGLFAKACLCRCAGKTLAQLHWIGTAKGSVPDDDRIYQIMAYELDEDTLRILLLNTSVVGKDIDSSTALAGSIEDSKDNPKLFRDPLVFKRVKE